MQTFLMNYHFVHRKFKVAKSIVSSYSVLYNSSIHIYIYIYIYLYKKSFFWGGGGGEVFMGGGRGI